jgi:hypothetical protein
MMAFYYKKQEEAKKLEAESEDAYLNSAWANPKVVCCSCCLFVMGLGFVFTH